MKQLKKKLDLIILIFFLVLTGALYAYISIIGHNHFQTFAWDLGFFDQIIWKASQGDFVAYSTIAKENLLADHFQPVLYLLAPLYWINSDVRMILIAQAFLVVSGAIPLYLLAKNLFKNIFFSFAIVFAYLFFLGTQWTILNEFHQNAFIPIFLSLVFWALQEKKRKVYWFGIGGLLATKEELGILVAAIGLVTWLGFSMKKEGIVTTVLGISSFFFMVYFLMPALSVRGVYSHFDFGDAGYTPVDVARKIVSDPTFFFRSMISPPIKIKTVLDSLSSFGFLPMFHPIFVFPILQQFITRFIYAGPQFTKWSNVNHHAAPLGILLSVAAIYSAQWISKKVEKKWKARKRTIIAIFGAYLIFTTIYQDIKLHGPINSMSKPQFYITLPWMKDNYAVISKVPDRKSVAAQNNLIPHLSQRNDVYLLPEVNNAEYIIVDLHNGPNKYSPLTYDEMKGFVYNLLTSKNYSIYYQKGDTMLLMRN